MVDLKPCPFCGGTNIKLGSDDYNMGIAYCNGCEAQVRGENRIELSDIFAEDYTRQNWQSAIAAWNRRVPYKNMSEAIEKQIPKKPRPYKDGGVCQRCGDFVEREDNYCLYCGQAIDWSEE